MNIIDLLRLIRKHIVLLIAAPLLLAALVILLTRKPHYTYTSETTLYTGIATGVGVEMQKSINFFATNTAFDNLINVIKSRQTQQEVGIRLFAMHLMLDGYNPKFISKESYAQFRQLTPPSIYKLVERSPRHDSPANARPSAVTSASPKQATRTKENYEQYFHTVKPGETLYGIAKKFRLQVDELRGMNNLTSDEIVQGQVLRISPFDEENMEAESQPREPVAEDTAIDTTYVRDTFSFALLDTAGIQQWLPSTVNVAAYEQTVRNLTEYMISSDTNFMYKLINFTHRHYSIRAIASVNVSRIASSDLVKLRYESDDPGICQHTLALLTEVCIKNYKYIKENRSDAVVKYFEYQVHQASIRLKIAEDKLLKFNKDNNIINYYEQSKAVAVVKEDLDVLYNNKRMLLEGSAAAIRRIEEKLNNLESIQLNSSRIMQLRNRIHQLNTQISHKEVFQRNDTSMATVPGLSGLRTQAAKAKEDLRDAINGLYAITHSTEGLPLNTLLSDWLKNVITFEETKAGLKVLGERIREFQKQYAIYAPAGANLKRIEREINVSEQAYLELLHGLNLAKLKMQDNELSSNIKAVDPPYFPLSANPTKRALLVMVAGILGFLIVFITILALEYFDDTLRNPVRAARILKMPSAGIFPKVYLSPGVFHFPYLCNRLTEMMVQKIVMEVQKVPDHVGPKVILLFSTREDEGKTVLSGAIAKKMVSQGHKVALLNFSSESMRRMEMSQTGYAVTTPDHPSGGLGAPHPVLHAITRILGYPDRRIDTDSPFLEDPPQYLSPDEYFEYQIDETFQTVKTYEELLRKEHIRIPFEPDYILIDIPPLLRCPYPFGLFSHCSLPLLVCRANRSWNSADQLALDEILAHNPSAPPLFLLNGVEIPVLESVLGDLPKKRDPFTRFIKRLLHFRIYEL